MFILLAGYFPPVSQITQARQFDTAKMLANAMDLANAGQVEQAKRLAEEIREQYPVDPGIQNKLGRVYERLGDAKQAEKSYQKAIQLAPKAEDYYLDLVSLLFLLEQPRKAVLVLKDGLQEIPSSYSLTVALGTATQVTGNKHEAMRIFERAIERRPNEAPAYVLLGKLESSIGLTDKAIAVLERAIKLDPNDARARYYLGSAYHAAGRPDPEAMKEFREALQIDASYALARYELAKGLERQKLVPEAINEYSHALKDDPSLMQIYYRLYKCYLRVGEEAKAQESLKIFQLYQDTRRPTLPPIPPLGRPPEGRVDDEQKH
jgi:tetratricopeptide (TPR) repeat protein